MSGDDAVNIAPWDVARNKRKSESGIRIMKCPHLFLKKAENSRHLYPCPNPS